MEFFEASGNWAVALGKTLIHSLWIGLLLLSILKIILQTIPGRYSNIRYRIATISLLIFLSSVVTLFLLLFVPLQAQTTAMTATQKFPGVIPHIQYISGNIGRSPVILLYTICSYIYFTGILIMLIRSINSFRQIHKLKREGVPIPGIWYERFLQIKNSMGIRRNVLLLESDRIYVPSVIGLLKPAVIVPVGMFTHLSPDQVETILMHELYHLRRFDFLVNLIQLVVEAIFFYNPAVWTISKMIRTERENCCDDRVIQSCGDPLAYARALFQLAEHHQLFHTLVPGALGSDQYQLFNRIKRILNQKNMKTNIREKLLSLLIMAGGVIILLIVSGFSSGFSIVKHSDSRQVLTASNVTLLPESIQTEAIVLDTIPVSEEKSPEKIDHAEIEKEMEAAKKEALAEIDWEEIKQEVEKARIEAMESIDWEELQMDFDFDFDFDVDIDMEAIKIEIKQTMKELEEVDWESIRQDMEKSLEEIDWEEINKEMENVRIHLDSVFENFDFDVDLEHELEKTEVEI